MPPSFGNTFWSKKFLQPLYEIDYSMRVPRGKFYAEQGKVRLVQIQDQVLSAKVLGSQKKPYLQSISFPSFSALEQECLGPIKERLKKELTLGIFSTDLQKELLEQQIHLYPRHWEELQVHCSCPDGANPCKHIAAVYFSLSMAIEYWPAILFELRGLGELNPPLQAHHDLEEVFQNHLRPHAPKISVWLGLPKLKPASKSSRASPHLSRRQVSFRKLLIPAYQIPSHQPSNWHHLELNFGQGLEEEELIRIEVQVDEHFQYRQIRQFFPQGTQVWDTEQSLARCIQALQAYSKEDLQAQVLSISCLGQVFHLAQEIWLKKQFMPQILALSPHKHCIIWSPRKDQDPLNTHIEQLAKSCPDGLLVLQSRRKKAYAQGLSQIEILISLFLNYFIQAKSKTQASGKEAQWLFRKKTLDTQKNILHQSQLKAWKAYLDQSFPHS